MLHAQDLETDCISINNQNDVDIAMSRHDINTPVSPRMLITVDNSTFIETGALSSYPGLSALTSERENRSSRGAKNYYTPAQDSEP